MDMQHPSNKKKIIIATTWEYLLKTGLSNASIGDLCRAANFAQSSLYYWFENKDDIWISAGKYGLSKVVDALFAFTLNHTNDIRKYFDTFLDEVEKYKYELRLAIQITTSPVFGKRMRDKSKDFRLLYEKYAEKIRHRKHKKCRNAGGDEVAKNNEEKMRPIMIKASNNLVLILLGKELLVIIHLY